MMKSSGRGLGILLLLVVALLLTLRVSTAAQPPIIINEILVGNAGINLDYDLKNFSGWIELRNTTGSSVNLKNYKIESWPDGADEPDTYTFKTGSVPANGYLLLWADETSGGNHLPLELDMDGGILRLTAPNNDYDEVEFEFDQSVNISYGRTGGDWAFFEPPTPGAANNTPFFSSNDEEFFSAAPVFSVQGGLQSGAISVTLSSTTPGATIRYTTDGARPTADSPLYSGPIAVNQTTVLRARAWAAGLMSSPPVTQTYFYGIDTHLPVVSLVTDADYMFDAQIGIYVDGNSKGKSGPNWNQSWERPTNIEYFEKDGSNLTQEVNQEIGLEISGNRTRKFAQKSFEVKARKVYGDNDLDYEFFPGQKPMDSYGRLILRNAGNDNNEAFLRDPLGHAIARGYLNVDLPAYRPVVVYVNGAYWGIYHMQEKTDEDYVENNYDLDAEEFDMLQIAGNVLNGNKDEWQALILYIKKNKKVNQEVYDYLATQIEIHSFIDYIILETFVGNGDWPMNNSRWWNDYDDDYQWRWVLRDLDKTFFRKNLKRDMIRWTLTKPGPTALVFKTLWKNADFRNEFAQRYAVHLNVAFQPERVEGLVDAQAADLEAEMPSHTERWKRPKSMEKWLTEVEVLRFMAHNRPIYARETLRKNIGKPGDATLTVHIVGDGRVLVAGAAVPDGYSGPHFKGIPIVMTAVPDSGQAFSHWVINGANVPDNPATLPFTATTTVTAYFDELPPPPPTPNLVINELHHTPASNDNLYEFLEIYNADDHTVDLSGYSLNGVDFTFPNGASIAAGEYIVVADTPASYIGSYQVFDFDGGLSNSGETIALIDAIDRVVDSVSYGVADPWPASPNAGGPSLSLLDPSLDNNNPVNWAASTEDGGTPGAENFPTP